MKAFLRRRRKNGQSNKFIDDSRKIQPPIKNDLVFLMCRKKTFSRQDFHNFNSFSAPIYPLILYVYHDFPIPPPL